MSIHDGNMKKIKSLIVFTIVVLVAVVNYKVLIGLLVRGFGIVFPFLLGGGIAFILNVPMRRIESLMKLKEKSRIKRPLSIGLVILLVLLLILLVVFVVVPQLFSTFMTLQTRVPAFLNEVQAYGERLFVKYPEIASYINSIQVDWKEVSEKILGFLSTGAGSVLVTTVSAAVSLVSGVTTFGIAFIFAIYILSQKENLSRQFTMIMRAFLPDSTTGYLLKLSKLTSETFSHFLTGQCVEAVILGTMFFITLSLVRLPYALLIGVLIAFTALIPIFGAFVGCVVGAFLMLMVNPIDALVFVGIFFLLQQIEGNLIYPHVVGNSVGLPSIWVLMAVTIGGSVMGVVGMLLFIPLCSVLYAVLREEVFVRLRRKAEVGTNEEERKENEEQKGVMDF